MHVRGTYEMRGGYRWKCVPGRRRGLRLFRGRNGRKEAARPKSGEWAGAYINSTKLRLAAALRVTRPHHIPATHYSYPECIGSGNPGLEIAHRVNC